MFCKNCGQQLLEDSKFCHKCGTPAVRNDIENEANRKMVYDGEIHKCPNCGEVLDSFTTICPRCGFELRGVKAADSVREFALKLETITAQRDRKYSEKTDEQKNTLIRSFIIPNNKEDIIEFMILASTNIETKVYESFGDANTNTRIKLADSWLIKIEQAYQKAKLTFNDDFEFQKVNELYNQIHKKVKYSKKVPMRILIFIILGFILFLGFPIIIACSFW